MTKLLLVVLVAASLVGCASCPTNDYQCEARRQYQANVMAAAFSNASNQQYQQAAYFRSQSVLPPVQTIQPAITPYTPQPIQTPSGEVSCIWVADPYKPGVQKQVCYTH